jgi:hypothetical protein
MTGRYWPNLDLWRAEDDIAPELATPCHQGIALREGSIASNWTAERSGGCQPLAQPMEAAFDHLAVAVVIERADSSLTTFEVLAGHVEITELAITLAQVEVQ